MNRVARWLNKRFVITVEIAGYALAVIVGACALFSAFKQVDVVTQATGELMPPRDTITFEAPAVLVAFEVNDGQSVAAGDPLCRIATAEEDRRAVLVSRHLRQVTAELEQGEAAMADTLVDVREALEALPSVSNALTLTAPRPGIVKRMIREDAATTLEPGKPFLALYRVDALLMEGVLTDDNAEKAAEGNVARLNLPGREEPLVGTVVSVKDGVASMRFTDVPPEVWQGFARQILEESEAPMEPLTAQIVVGHESLFMSTFGRKSQAVPAV